MASMDARVALALVESGLHALQWMGGAAGGVGALVMCCQHAETRRQCRPDLAGASSGASSCSRGAGGDGARDGAQGCILSAWRTSSRGQGTRDETGGCCWSGPCAMRSCRRAATPSHARRALLPSRRSTGRRRRRRLARARDVWMHVRVVDRSCSRRERDVLSAGHLLEWS